MCHKNLQSGLKMLHIISGCEHPVVASFAVALFMLDYLENRIELDSIKSWGAFNIYRFPFLIRVNGWNCLHQEFLFIDVYRLH